MKQEQWDRITSPFAMSELQCCKYTYSENDTQQSAYTPLRRLMSQNSKQTPDNTYPTMRNMAMPPPNDKPTLVLTPNVT